MTTTFESSTDTSAEATRQYPCVSVIVSTYNRPALLDRALASIAAQTYRDFEVIVIDDASDDKEALATVLKKWAVAFAADGINFTAASLGENSGYQALPKNQGIEQASGDYICFLDDDNEYLPRFLECMVAAMHEGDVWPHVVYCRWEYVRDEGVGETTADGVPLPVGITPLIEFDIARLVSSPLGNFIDTSSFMTSRGMFWYLHELTGSMWNERWRRFGDWELMTRLVKGGGVTRFVPVDEVLMRYHWITDAPGQAGNLQLTRRYVETPVPVSLTSGEVLK